MSQFDKKAVVACFNRAANTYNSACLLQHEIAQRLLEHLDAVPLRPQVIVDLGAATGYTTQLLAQRFPAATLFALDVAERMLNKIPETMLPCPQQRICTDYENLPFAPQSVDLVFSNLTFAWAIDLEKILQQIRYLLKPGGLLLFSTFGPDTLKEVKASWATVDNKQHVHLFFDMHDIGDMLLQMKFTDPVMEMEHVTVSYPNAKILFEDLKAAGFRNIAAERFGALTGKQRFHDFLAAYQEYTDSENLLPATYEIIYGHARRADFAVGQVADEQGEVRILVSEIKTTKKNKI